MRRLLILGALVMGFPSFSLAYPDQVVLAVHDLIHYDPVFRDWAGGRALAGTADVDPGETTVLGTGTSWATGDDSLGPGDQLVLAAQVATVEDVASDTELTITVPHADGMVAGEAWKAGRGFRVESPSVPVDVALPYWTVGIGSLPEFSPAIGRLASTPSVQVTFVYEIDQHPLRDDVASWAGLAQRVIAILTASGPTQRLTVGRFGQPLTLRVSGAAPGEGLLRRGSDLVPVPAVQITWEGMDPIDRALVAQRW